MLRRAVVLAFAVTVLAACGASEPDELASGEMTSQDYVDLISQDDLTIADVEADGAIVSEKLEAAFVDEGGQPALDVNQCRYARTLDPSRDEQYRGTARFCFDAQGRSVAVERNPID
ncbi:hypothetical protein [Aeromicrobium alkaliterrae]|uniref:DUF4333 domain-containing protein n=1 Tax=Aeromicrobium alkaliterrae TaxID=302168 RepID=A0ABN2JNM4_9ACTN